MGWKIAGTLPGGPKLVLILGPHTSAWDFVIGVGAKLALRLEARFLAKHTLFRGPLGWFMRGLGGFPVDRSAPGDLVSSIVERFRRSEHLVLALAPEGTRRAGATWKTGFYYIAAGARAPIVPVALDYATKRLKIGAPRLPTGDLDRDLAELQGHFAGLTGKRR